MSIERSLLLALCLAACAETHTASAVEDRATDSVRDSLSRSTEGLVVEHRPDGITKLHLQRRFASVSVITADGKLMCVDSQQAFDRARGATR